MPVDDNEVRTGDEPPGSNANALPRSAIRLILAAASVIGLSGLLYAAGFLATRSHQTFWGFWPGQADDASAMVSEGGRFMYHLALVFIDLLNPLSSGMSAGFYAVLIAALALWAIPTAPMAGLFARRTLLVGTVRFVLPFVLALATYVWGLVLLREFATIMAPASVLTLQGVVPPDVMRLVCTPSDVYFSRVTDWILLGVLSAATVWALRICDNVVSRGVAVIGAILFLATTSLLPAVFGRLVLVPEYPTVEFTRDAGKPLERVLIRGAGSQWVVWNMAARKTEVISVSDKDKESVIIGPRRSLTLPTNCDRRG
jgi:hypothetical protein